MLQLPHGSDTANDRQNRETCREFLDCIGQLAITKSTAQAPGDGGLVQPGVDGLLGSPTPMASLQGRARGFDVDVQPPGSARPQGFRV